MPVNIKVSQIKYKDANGDYVGINGVSERATAEEIAAIEAKGAQTIASIPSDYTALSNEVVNLISAFASRELAFDVFAMYGKPESKTHNGVTYSWDGQTCTVTGTATSMSFNNFIVQELPAKGIEIPPKFILKQSGDSQNVSVQFFTLKNGSIVQQKSANSNGVVRFTSTDIDYVLVRLYVASGSTASGSITVKIYNDDAAAFGVHVLDYLKTGDNFNSIGTGLFLFDSSYTYVNPPPIATGYVLSFILENTGLQLVYPYSPGGTNNTSPVVRSKHTDGTWTEWYTMSEFSQVITKYASNGSVNINNVKEPGFYLLHDGYTYENLPYSGIGFLFVYRSQNVRFQMTIPWAMNAMYLRRQLNEGNWSSWQALAGSNTYNVTNEYSFPEYSQSVTLNASPSITSDTNNYLAPTGTTADRTADILAMLSSNGICRLGAGDYYVSNLQMPDGSSIIGSGYSTRIVLSGTGDGYAIRMNSRCLVQDLCIVGAESEPTFGSTIGGRHGILWQGDYTEHQTAPNRSMVSNVWIYNFTGGGITCYDTGYPTSSALEVVNAYIFQCWAGINISYWSEFHKFTNVRCGGCRIGCINNGGNNVFVNCDFSSNYEIAMLMDNSQGQSPNHTHGSAIGCVFNHTMHAGTSNAGIGVEILNCGGSGFIFEGCQIFFSQIHLVDSDGIVFASCNFGNSNCNITISGGGAVLFNGNMHQAKPPISITNNQNVHFVNCYVKTTGATVTP